MEEAKYLVSSFTRLRAMGSKLAAVIANESANTSIVVELRECKSVNLGFLGNMLVKDLAFDGSTLYVLAEDEFGQVLFAVEDPFSGKGTEELRLALTDPVLEAVSFDYGPYSGLCFLESCVVGALEGSPVALPVTEVARGRFVGKTFAVATSDEVTFFSVDVEGKSFEVLARAQLPFLMTKEVWSTPWGVVVSPNDFNRSAAVALDGEVEELSFYATGVYVGDAVYISGYRSDMTFVVEARGFEVEATLEFEPPKSPADIPLLYIGEGRAVTLTGKCIELTS